MTSGKHAVYIGADRPNGFTGFIAQDDLYMVIDVTSGLTHEEGHKLIEELKRKLHSKKIIDLTHFDQTIEESLTHLHVDHVSLAAGIILDNILYLKTKGKGKVFVRRGDTFVLLLEGKHTASGYVKPADTFLFATEHFVKLVEDEKKLANFLGEADLRIMLDEITPLLKSQHDQGAVALFTRFEKEVVEEEPLIARPVEEPTEPEDEETDEHDEEQREELPKEQAPAKKSFGLFSKLKQMKQNVAEKQARLGKRNVITIAVVSLIFVVLLWSVVLGYKRRATAEKEKKVAAAKELIMQKLDQAEDVAFLNLPRSIVLVTEAKQEVDKLVEEVGEEQKGVSELKQLVSTRETQITKKDEKKPEEFFDMTLEEKQAKGNKMYLEEDVSAILDNSNGIVYLFSLQKKSIEKRRSATAKKASLVALSDGDAILYVPSQGIYQITGEGDEKKVIENDSEWADIKGMYVYNGNIYLLDAGKSNVYKYPVIEGGYAAKQSYFKSATPSMREANSISIDASVYIDLKSRVVKFTAGGADAFQNGIPEDDTDITKAYTDKNETAVYAWDKHTATVYVLGKDGTYHRQVKSSILAQADDLVAYEGVLYVLSGSKIYSVATE